MRIAKELLFKGLDRNNRWIVSPYLVKEKNETFLIKNDKKIKIVGDVYQNIGEKDINKREIFEGDIAICFSGYGPRIGVFLWNPERNSFGFTIKNVFIDEFESRELKRFKGDFVEYFFPNEMFVISHLERPEFSKEIVEKKVKFSGLKEKIYLEFEKLKREFEELKKLRR